MQRGPLWCLVLEVDGIPINQVPETPEGILQNVNKKPLTVLIKLDIIVT